MVYPQDKMMITFDDQGQQLMLMLMIWYKKIDFWRNGFVHLTSVTIYVVPKLFKSLCPKHFITGLKPALRINNHA